MGVSYRPRPIAADENTSAEDVAQRANVESRRVAAAINQWGGVTRARRVVTGNTIIASTDGYVFADTTAGAVTATLPFAREYPFLEVGVKRVAGVNTYTVAAQSGDTIDGAASVTVTGTVRRFVPVDGTTWTEV